MAFEELKQRHAVMWGSAPFERIVGTLADMHGAIVGAVEANPGDRWHDLLGFFRREERESGLQMSRPYLLICGIRKD